MSELTDERSDTQPINAFHLPPMFGPIENGKRTWIRIEKLDHDMMGYVLSSHLIIEHYMEAFLKAHHKGLDWVSARLTFGQKVALLTTWNVEKPFNPVEQIKHLNALRNRLGHRVDYQLSEADMLPFVRYLQAVEDTSQRPDGLRLADRTQKQVMELFVSIASAVFAGSVSRAT